MKLTWDQEKRRQHKSIPFCLETSWIIRDEMNMGSGKEKTAQIHALLFRDQLDNKG
jgi:hypothetical protein